MVEKLGRYFAIIVLAVGALVVVGIALGVRYNGTESLPVGFYLETHKRPEKGDLVAIRVPALPVVEEGKRRGYLDIGYSPVGHLLKHLSAVAGDRVTISSKGVEVNGARLCNSAPLPCDDAGRPLRPCFLTNYILHPGEVLVMSDYTPASFDARYFGPIEATTIESVAVPLLTW